MRARDKVVVLEVQDVVEVLEEQLVKEEILEVAEMVK